MTDSKFWEVTVPRVMSTYAVVIFAVLWIGFAVAFLVDPGWLDTLWNWVRALPLLVEIIVWVLFLPIMVGLWIWESSWPAFARWLGFAGIVGWTVLALYRLLAEFSINLIFWARYRTRKAYRTRALWGRRNRRPFFVCRYSAGNHGSLSGIEDQALGVIMFQGFAGPGILFNDQIQN